MMCQIGLPAVCSCSSCVHFGVSLDVKLIIMKTVPASHHMGCGFNTSAGNMVVEYVGEAVQRLAVSLREAAEYDARCSTDLIHYNHFLIITALCDHHRRHGGGVCGRDGAAVGGVAARGG